MSAETGYEPREGAVAGGLLPDGREWVIYPMIYTFRLVVGAPGDFFGYDDAWCYETFDKALLAATTWDGTSEPSGWHRHPASGRRRPNGDATQEYVNR